MPSAARWGGRAPAAVCACVSTHAVVCMPVEEMSHCHLCWAVPCHRTVGTMGTLNLASSCQRCCAVDNPLLSAQGTR